MSEFANVLKRQAEMGTAVQRSNSQRNIIVTGIEILPNHNFDDVEEVQTFIVEPYDFVKDSVGHSAEGKEFLYVFTGKVDFGDGQGSRKFAYLITKQKYDGSHCDEWEIRIGTEMKGSGCPHIDYYGSENLKSGTKPFFFKSPLKYNIIRLRLY